MPQTPKSVSTFIADPSILNTIYTCPAATTAVISAIYAMPVNGVSTGNFGIGKTVSGVFYPQIYRQNGYTAATGATNIGNVNLLDGPITLAAGESLTMSSDLTSNFAFPRTSPNILDNFGTQPTVYDILFANSIYMAVGRCGGGIQSAYVATSSDGVTWTQQVAAIAYNYFTDVAYISTGNLWVAISGSTLVYSTNNGATWTPTSTVPSTTDIPYQLASNGTTTIAVYVNTNSSTNHNVWYTTNGITWTAATNFQGNTNYGGTVSQSTMRGLTYSGTHFVVSQTGSTQVTTDFNNWQYLGCISNNPLGLSANNCFSLRYSSAYGRYYQANLGNANVNRSIVRSGASADSKLWSYVTTSPAVAYAQIECAGSNTILIAKPDASSTVRAKSTDGVNFTAATDARGANGVVLGLGNGYYYTQNGVNSNTWAASTDPTVSVGTTFAPSSTFYSTNGAGDPVSGAWVIMGYDNASTNMQIGGATAITGGASYLNPFDNATYGIPMDVCWHSTDSKFYCISQKGGVFSATAANAVAGTWTFLGWMEGSTGSNRRTNLIVVNNTIYATGTGLSNTIYIAPVATSLSFVSFVIPTMYGNAVSSKSLATNVWSTNCPYMATNGTNIVCGGSNNFVNTWVPANSRNNVSSPPAGVARVDLVNGNQIAYGGISNNVVSGGIYSSTNIVTDYGYSSYVQGNQGGQAFPNYQRAGYASGNYYVTMQPNGAVAFGTSSNDISKVTVFTTNSVAGVSNITPEALATNGTTLVYYDSAAAFLTSNTPAPSRASATITAALVEIT